MELLATLVNWYKSLTIGEKGSIFNSDKVHKFSSKYVTVALFVQRTLSISTNLYLELLSISNKKLGPWTFMDSVCYFYLFISNFSISNFSLFQTKMLVTFNYFSLYLELFLFTQQTERKCSIFENSNVIKTFETQKFDCNQNIINIF